MAPKKSASRPSKKAQQVAKHPRTKKSTEKGSSSTTSVPTPPGLRAEHQPRVQNFNQEKIIKPNEAID